MRSLLILSTIASLCLALAGCGEASKGGGADVRVSSHAGNSPVEANSGIAAPGSYLKGDGDKDNDDTNHPNPRLSDDIPFLVSYGKEASPAEKRAITEVIKRYYAAAVAQDGAVACPLLYPALATVLIQGAGQQGDACAAALSRLFNQHHAQLVADRVPTMIVISVRLGSSLGVAELGFQAMPRGNILLAKEGRTWKIDAILDSEMT
jgi:hypothetical protein